nr:hypothetical protein CFP56_43115 [Quercus suber]
MKPRTLSREEETKLARSNKKVKGRHHEGFKDGSCDWSGESSPTTDCSNPPNAKETSFKDKLIGTILGAFAKAFNLADQMDEDTYSDDDDAEVRLHELPIELYETGALKQIGKSLGKVLRIDAHTTMEARGKYTRLCIQIDVNKLLVNTILIGHFEQPVTYEGIYKLCFPCGRVGHKVEAFPYMIQHGNDTTTPGEDGQDGVAGNSRNKHEDQ